VRRFSNLEALPLSFFSRDLYRDVAGNWKGAGLLYQLMVIALATLVVAIRLHLGIAEFAAHEAPPVIAQVPTIRIVRGEVSVNRLTPVTIRNPKSGKAVAIIDTSGKITSLEGTEARLLLTRNQAIVLRRPGFTQVYDLRNINNLQLDRPTLTRWLGMLAGWFAILCSPFILAGLYFGRLLVLLIGSTVLFLVAKGSNRVLDFAASTRLASVALTPATLLEIALDAIGTKPGFWGFLWLLLAGGYLAFAYRSGRGEAPAPGDTIGDGSPGIDVTEQYLRTR
jgi:hypothetical protein